MPNTLIKVLLLEDDPLDAELIQRVLTKSGLNVFISVVDNRGGFVKYLETQQPDLILADYLLPDFSGVEALQLSIQFAPFVPFIFVTGTIGEELAAETVLNGAWGFVLKTNLDRLTEVVNNSLFKAQELRVPWQSHSMLTTSQRLQNQIETNHKILKQVRNFIATQPDVPDWLADLENELNISNEGLLNLGEEMRNDKKD